MSEEYFISESQDTLKVTGFDAKLNQELSLELETLLERINKNLSFAGQVIVIEVKERVPE